MFRLVLLFIHFSGIVGIVHPQAIEPSSVLSAGGHGSTASGTLSWSLGQISGASFSTATDLITSGVQQPDVIWLSLNVRTLLSGPFDPGVMLMSDALRTSGAIPPTEPYTAAGFQHTGQGGGEQLFPAALLVSGPDAIVDWVVIELRDPSSPLVVLSSRCGLLQRDGDVVDVDGSSSLRISAIPGNYHLAVRHRNHLPVMTGAPITLGTSITVIDIANGSVPVFGVDALRSEFGVELLWAGDVNGDHQVKYVNALNDRDPILVHIGGTVPTNVVAGYSSTDVNMDGVTKYAGSNNDRDPILFTVGGTIPTAIRQAQFP